MPRGKRRTLAQRRRRHKRRYGTTKVPRRGRRHKHW